jgi:uncharacterized protein (TIGR03083 family)
VTTVAQSLFSAYARTRDRIIDLLETTSEDERTRVVPACPDWTVHDLLAHVVSIPAALSSGRRPTGPIGDWLNELVAERSEQPDRALQDEWRALDRELEALLSGPSGLLFGDLAIHEHDFRGALDRPDHGALEIEDLLPRTIGAFKGPLKEAGLAPIEVRAGDRVWRSHEGEAGWTLVVDPWTAVRALNSRRTADELCALPSRGDASGYLPILDAHLPLPARSLGEA